MFQPQPFGKYYLFDKLAVGGMAEIFLAKIQAQLEGNRFLVIKRILPHYSDNAQFVDMFIDEAKISAQLRHVNIVPLHDLGKIGDSYFLAMEWVPGQDLKAIVTRCRERGLRLSFEHAAFIVCELLKGLDYAHKKADPTGRPLGIVHRDISPQNVLVGYDGQVKILDFGIAKAESKLDSTQAGTLKGKFGYMAPEQVVSGTTLDHRADLFAAGVILWELLTGMRLFSGTNEIEILERVRSARIDPPSTFAPDVPRDLEKVVFRALMKDRDKRYTSGAEMSQDLARFLATHAPNFSHDLMSSAMRELFAPEIESIRQRWNVTIVDVGLADEGARLEASLVDARTVMRTPPPTAAPARTPPPRTPPPMASPAPTRVAAPRTPPPMASPPPEPRITTARTTIQPPLVRGNLHNELFDDLETSPFEEEQDRTTTTPAAGHSDDRITQPRNVVRTPETTQAGTRTPMATQAGVRMPQATQTVPAVQVVPNSGTRRVGRAFLGVVLLAALAAAGVGFWLKGNPFAPPMIEVVSTVEAVVRIDGNIVLAAGNAGKWPVGAGERVVEVTRAGYEPLVKTVTVAAGQTVYVDAELKPLPNAVADTPIETVPPGAKVWLDDVEQAGVTPLVVHPSMGEHRIRVAAEGFDEQTVTFRANHPGNSPPVKVALVPNVASVLITTDPSGADVTVNGKSVGQTPVKVGPKDLDPRALLEIALSLAGHESQTVTHVLPGGPEPSTVEVRLHRVDVPPTAPGGPAATAMETPAAAAPEATTKPKRQRGVLIPANAPPEVQDEIADGSASSSQIAAASDRGFLTIEVPNGWGEVWIDGKRVADRTPLEGFSVAAGVRTVRVVNPQTKKERTVEVEVQPGYATTQMVPLD